MTVSETEDSPDGPTRRNKKFAYAYGKLNELTAFQNLSREPKTALAHREVARANKDGDVWQYQGTGGITKGAPPRRYTMVNGNKKLHDEYDAMLTAREAHEAIKQHFQPIQ